MLKLNPLKLSDEHDATGPPVLAVRERRGGGLGATGGGGEQEDEHRDRDSHTVAL